MNITFGAEQFSWIEPAVSVGAVLLGAALAWGTSYYFENKRLKQAKKGIAYSLVFKVLLLADEVWKLNREISSAMGRPEDGDAKSPLWTRLQDVIRFDENPERITAQELALVADTRDADLVMKVLEFQSGHSILMQAIGRIQELRNQLNDLDLAQSVDGRTVSFGGPVEEYPKYAHIFIHLNDLSDGLETQAARIANTGRELAGKLGPHLKRFYNFDHFVTLTMAPPTQSSNEVVPDAGQDISQH